MVRACAAASASLSACATIGSLAKPRIGLYPVCSMSFRSACLLFPAVLIFCCAVVMDSSRFRSLAPLFLDGGDDEVVDGWKERCCLSGVFSVSALALASASASASALALALASVV